MFHALYDTQGPDLYTVQLVLGLEGPLDSDALRVAAEALLERHANLRASFVHDGLSRPVQVITPEVALPGAKWISQGWVRRRARSAWRSCWPKSAACASNLAEGPCFASV